jgi:polysaccharide export outer membrane protein
MRAFLIFAFAISLTNCGVVYNSTSVRAGVADGAKVRVIPVTPQSVLVANRQPYEPRSLPAAFNATAGLHGSSGIYAHAPEPVYLPQTRPNGSATRLPPPPPDEPYRIGVGDVVLLATKSGGDTVSELAGLLAAESRRQGYTVQDDGAIAVPDVGRVRLAGMTLEEAETTLFQELLERQIDPSFSIEIAEFNARKVAIGGAVANPGVVPITLTPLTLDAALTNAGGTNAPDRSTAVIRIYRDGTLYQIPLEEFLASPDYRKLRLVDGDSVFVDTEYDLEAAESYFRQQIELASFQQSSRTTALSALSQEVSLRRSELQEQRQNFQTRLDLGAEQRDYVYLAGEVGTQQRWPLPFDQKATVADALYDSGAVAKQTGNPKQIYVLRGSPDPREFAGLTAWHINGANAAGLMLMTRMELRPDDVIFVAEQPVTRWSRTINQMSPSLVAIPLNNAVN